MGKIMNRSWLLLLLLGWSGMSFACGDSPKAQPSVGDVVFNRISPESVALDRKLQEMYGCKYPFAMIFSSAGYDPMRLLSGSQPATPKDESGVPITGRVLVGFVLNTDGSPVDPVVLESGDERLSKLALEHVVGLKYQSARFKSRPVRALGVQVYQFK
jgi:hypothetical protein